MASLKDMFDNFMYDRRLAGLSPKSLDNYNYFLLPFLSFCGEDTDVQAVSNAQIGAYIEKFMEKGVSQGTLSTTIRHLRCSCVISLMIIRYLISCGKYVCQKCLKRICGFIRTRRLLLFSRVLKLNRPGLHTVTAQ